MTPALSVPSIMHLILLISLLATCTLALTLDPVYVDEDGVLWSHPLIDGKAITVNNTLKPLSNRALLKAGLPPRSPKFVRDAVAKRVPTPAEMAPRSVMTMVPLPDTANIIVRNAQGTLGFIGSELTIFETFQPVAEVAQAATFTITSTDGFIDLAVASEGEGFIGLGVGAAGTNFGPGSASYGFMTAVPESSTIAFNPFTDGGSESMIWQINLATLQLTAAWRTNGGSVPLTIFHDISFGDLDFAGDLAAFVNVFQDSVEPVTLLLIPK